MHPSDFLFTTCQVGAETALKAELARLLPAARLAFSRPGFLTFKLAPEHGLAPDFDLGAAFARSYGFSIGKVEGALPEELAAQVWRLAGREHFDRLHVWQRDTAPPGAHGFEPQITEAALAAQRALRLAEADRDLATAPQTIPLGATRPGHRVLDVVLVEPNLWWVGTHQATSRSSCWPGGIPPLALPPSAVSRAWLKMEEALRWSGLPIKPGQRCAEIGAAPGGASQALLDRGLVVMGIDPAEMHADVLAHQRFTHIRKRGADVRRREFRKVRWLTADMNVAPAYMLDTIESIVTHREVDVRGMLLTLKLLDWELAAEVPAYLQRVRGWGYADVRARQLVHNRQEVCLAALRQTPQRRRPPAERRRRQAPGERRNTPA